MAEPKTARKADSVVLELEGIAARLAAQRILPEQLQTLCMANERCAAAETVKDFNVVNVYLHDTVIEASHNLALQDQLRIARPKSFPYRHHLTNAPGYMRRSVKEHGNVILAIAAGQPVAAQTAMTKHVNLQGEEIVNFLQRF